MTTHECSFAEEQEPSGRLVLCPCLICGLSAMDALKQTSAERGNLLEALRNLVGQVRAKWPDHEWKGDTSAWGKPMRDALAAIKKATP